MRALLCLLLSATLLAACAPASRTKPDAVPKAPAASAPAQPSAEAAEQDAEPDDAGLVEVVETDAGALADVVRDFLRAANGDDDAAAKALSTDACWADECSGFAKQAGTKFEARAGAIREHGERASAHAEVICPGERKCDEVELLLQRADRWRVADITEDDSKVEAWLSNAAPSAPAARRPLSADEQRDHCGFKGSLICCLGSNPSPGDKAYCYPQ